MKKINECLEDTDLETLYGERKNNSFFFIFYENYIKIFLEIVY